MRRREAMPDGFDPALVRALFVGDPQATPFDPFTPDDHNDLMRAAADRRRPDAKGATALTPARAAIELSFAALVLMSDRRIMGPTPRGEKIRRLEQIARQADSLHSAVAGDAIDLFDPDIGHSEAVRKLLGIWSPVPDEDRSDWWRVDAAAAEVREAIFIDLPAILRLAAAAAREQATRHPSPPAGAQAKKDGARGDTPHLQRHGFVSAVMGVYEASTGRRAALSRAVGATEKSGPAARFLSMVCVMLADRLQDSEKDADPELEADLREAATEAVAAQWIETAIRWEKAAGPSRDAG